MVCLGVDYGHQYDLAVGGKFVAHRVVEQLRDLSRCKIEVCGEIDVAFGLYGAVGHTAYSVLG